MFANKLGLIAITALAGAPGGAPAPLPPESPMSIELVIQGPPAEVPWAEALGRRARETFAAAAHARFVVTVEPTSRGVVVWVADDTGLTTTRTFAPATPVEASAWLFVKSTIERSLRDRETELAGAAPAAAPPPARLHLQAPALPATDDAPAQLRFMALARLGSAPAGGAAFGVQRAAGAHLLVDADLGYARTLEQRALRLHEVLLGLGLAATWGESPAVVCGLRAEGEAKLVSAGGRSRTSLGAAVGPYFESQLRAHGVTLLLRAGLLGRLVRHRYLHDQGALRESVWLADVAAGVGW